VVLARCSVVGHRAGRADAGGGRRRRPFATPTTKAWRNSGPQRASADRWAMRPFSTGSNVNWPARFGRGPSDDHDSTEGTNKDWRLNR